MQSCATPARLRGVVLALLMAGTGGCAGNTPKGVTLQVALKSAHYHLPNGLEVVLHEDRSLRNVVVDVHYHVGSKDDPPGRSGFAHLYEHLMFLGSHKVSEAGFTQALDEVGTLSYNASTGSDTTEYHELVPPAALPVALWLEADRMASPLERLTPETFGRECDVVKNEWRQNYDNVPFGHVRSFVRAAVFPEGHPYHRPPIGVPEELDRASIEEAKAFGARFYTPSNATLVVVGDIDVPQTKKLVDELFGAIPAGEPIPPRTFAVPHRAKDQRITVEADVEHPRVVVAWMAPPPYSTGWDEVHLATARLANMTRYKLHTKDKVASSVGWSIAPGRLGSLVTVTVDLDAGQNPSTVVDTIESRAGWLAGDHLIESMWSDLADSRTSRMTNTVIDLSDPLERAERLQDYTEYFGEPDSAQADLRRIQAVRVTDAVAASRAFLDAPKTIVTVVPTRNAPRSGKVVR